MDLLDEITQQSDGFLLHQLFVLAGEEIGSRGQVVGMFVVIFPDGPQCIDHAVAAFFHLHFDALDDSHEIAGLESFVHSADDVMDVLFRSRKH